MEWTPPSQTAKEAVMKAKCAGGVKKYKFSYTRGTMKPSSSTVYCKK